MKFKEKHCLMDEDEMNRTLTRIAFEIAENNKRIDNLALIGIRRRGVSLAEWLADIFKKKFGTEISLGALDITLYRDDLTMVAQQPILYKTYIPFTVDNMHVVLVDDVIYTGRTIRAALDAVMDFGRPNIIQLAVLIDRGGRELPVQADYIGRKVHISGNEVVTVKVKDYDQINKVVIEEC